MYVARSVYVVYTRPAFGYLLLCCCINLTNMLHALFFLLSAAIAIVDADADAVA